MWWKALSIVLIIYTILAGMLVPLKSGIQSGKDKAQSGQSASSAELNAVLTFYRSEDRWELGKVELK